MTKHDVVETQVLGRTLTSITDHNRRRHRDLQAPIRQAGAELFWTFKTPMLDAARQGRRELQVEVRYRPGSPVSPEDQMAFRKGFEDQAESQGVRVSGYDLTTCRATLSWPSAEPAVGDNYDSLTGDV
jgi:hypothetical protein